MQASKNAKKTYSAFAIFKDEQQAIEAFVKLEGDLEKVCLLVSGVFVIIFSKHQFSLINYRSHICFYSSG